MDSVKAPVQLDLSKLRRAKPEREEQPPEPPPAANALRASIVEFAFNPSEDKIREVTIIDRFQGRLLPQLDLVDEMWEQCLEVATYRQDSANFEKVYKRKLPFTVSPIRRFVYRTAQWQKSVSGKNLERATDIALAETETRSGDGEDAGDNNPYRD